MTNLISVENLSLGLHTKFGLGELVSDVSFSIRAGETLALVGESGCGKTLTSLALMRLLPNNIHYLAGSSISLQQQNILHISEDEMQRVRGCKIGMIFQEPMSSLNPVYSVGQQLDEVLKLHTSLSTTARINRSMELLDAVGIADPMQRLNTYPHQLSGGLKQRVMIAVALACEPQLLIADEPTTALDVTIQAQILALLATLQKSFGVAMLLVSHDLGVVSQLAHNVAVMYAGHIVESAPVEQFFKGPLHPYSRQLFNVLPDFSKRHTSLSAIPGHVPTILQRAQGCRFANRCQLMTQQCVDKEPQLQQLEQRDVRCWHYQKSMPILQRETQQKTATGSLRLALNQLKVSFPITRGIFKRKVAEIKAVDQLSLTIHAGETVALVGESGCGKSTLAKAVLQLIKPTSGSVCFDSRELIGQSHHDIAQSCQMVFQDPSTSLNPRMLVGDIIAEGLKQQPLRSKEIVTQVHTIAEQVGLSKESLNRYPHEFSGGQRQRIGIARALAMRPDVMICDEPTSALDLSTQAQILNLLQSIQQQTQIAYLFISHDLSVVSYLADKVAVMYLGQIVEAGHTEDIIKNPQHPYTISLLQAIPTLDPNLKLNHVKGEQPSPSHPPEGCHFHPRCPHAMPICQKTYPSQTELKNAQVVNCHLQNPE